MMSKTRIGLLILAAILLVAGPALAWDDRVEQALAALEKHDEADWAFTITKVEDGKRTVARHDPELPEDERWVLVSVDGEPPTEEELEEFREGLEKRRAAEDAEDSEDGEVRAMISPEGLELIEETATHAVYRFKPAAEDEEDAKMYEHVDATLRIATNGSEPFVESIELVSREPFSPAFSVKIKRFEIRMTFAPFGPEGAVLPETVHVRLAGRVLLVKKIDETVDVRYDDYRYVGE